VGIPPIEIARGYDAAVFLDASEREFLVLFDLEPFIELYERKSLLSCLSCPPIQIGQVLINAVIGNYAATNVGKDKGSAPP
jgi:hypothetical protein